MAYPPRLKICLLPFDLRGEAGENRTEPSQPTSLCDFRSPQIPSSIDHTLVHTHTHTFLLILLLLNYCVYHMSITALPNVLSACHSHNLPSNAHTCICTLWITSYRQPGHCATHSDERHRVVYGMITLVFALLVRKDRQNRFTRVRCRKKIGLVVGKAKSGSSTNHGTSERGGIRSFTLPRSVCVLQDATRMVCSNWIKMSIVD